MTNLNLTLTPGSTQLPAFDVDQVRQDFPILHQEINGHPLVYLDNAATTQKPDAVIDAISNYYRTSNANVHRGAHTLSERATEAFEGARETVRAFINAPSSDEVIWTRGTTEGINVIAACFARRRLQAGDTILVSSTAHHSNIVPWQMATEETGAELVPIPVLESGAMNMNSFKALLHDKPRLVAIEHVSNAFGTINDIGEIIRLAHQAGAQVLVDGAQAMAHWPVDVQALDVDFYVFSAHKMFGPTGMGVLYAKREWLNAMPPYQGGGEMIESVSFAGTTYNQLPYKFEAGTPDIAGAIGLAAAIDYLNALDRVAAAAHEVKLLDHALQLGEALPGFQLIGRAPDKTGVLSFLLEGGHPHDVGTLLDQQGVAVRTGHHCAQPIMDQLGIPGTVRASFSIYNTHEEVERLFTALKKVQTFL
ncbi:MAG: aminotransferase class V-fold PLP-dependent enzyme [Pseudomonadales bacterium]